MRAITRAFNTVVSAFNGLTLSSGLILQSSTLKVDSLPRLLWRTGGWESEVWQPFIYQVKWDIPAELTVQGPSGDPGPVQEALEDLYDWADLIYGLPVNSEGLVVPFSDEQQALEAKGELFSIGERFVGPYIKRAIVRPGEADGSFSVADITFHVDFLVNATPESKATAQVFVVGANIDPAHTVLQNPYEPYELPIPNDADVKAQGAFAKPDTILRHMGDEVEGSFYPLVQDIPSLDGPDTDTTLRSILVVPYTATLEIAGTRQFNAIGMLADGSTVDLNHLATWASSSPTVATVSSAGLVTAVTSGTTNITAAYNGLTSNAGVVTITALAFDLTAGLPSGMTLARTGSDLYVSASATTATKVAAGAGDLFDNRGGDEGGGVWTFPSYTNGVASPLDIASASWLSSGTVVKTQNAGVAPDGTTTAANIRDSDAAAAAAVYQQTDLLGQEVGSVWAMDTPGDAPTSVGGYHINNTAAVGNSFLTGSSWRRLTFFDTSTITPTYMPLYPAGYAPPSFTNSATGALRLWGAQVLLSGADVPLVNGSTGAATLQITSNLGSILYGGDLDFEAEYIQSYKDTTALPNVYLFSANTPDGLLAFRYTTATQTWTLTVRGVDVLSTVLGVSELNDLVKFRVRYKPSTGVSGIRISLNGAVQTNVSADGDKSGTATGAALSAPTNFYLGSNLGASSIAARWTAVRIYNGDSGAYLPEGMIIGDSIMSWTNVVSLTPFVCSPSYIYTPAQAQARAGIISIAHPADTVNDQTTLFSASPYKALSSIRWVIIQTGVNDVIQGHSAATIIADLQTQVNTVRASQPTAKIIIGRMTPCGAAITIWNAVNDAIDGTGGTPITGVDYRVSNNSIDLDTGPGLDTLAPAYSFDGVHPNNLGRRTKMIPPYVTALTALGLL